MFGVLSPFESRLGSELRQNWDVAITLPEPSEVDAAVAVAITDEDDPQVLLIRRAAHLRRHAGEIAFPGGRREPGDVDLLHTALRESEEEVALPPECFDYVGPLSTRQTRAGLRVWALMGVIPPNLPLVPDPGELDTLFYVPLAFFAERANLQREVYGEGARQMVLARYDWQGMRIWGMTAMMLLDLANRAAGAELTLV